MKLVTDPPGTRVMGVSWLSDQLLEQGQYRERERSWVSAPDLVELSWEEQKGTGRGQSSITAPWKGSSVVLKLHVTKPYK